MKKLIDLLNKQMEEKEKIGPKLARFTGYDGINKVFNLNNGCSFGVEFVLSKRYEFIKRLVYNNKINRDKVKEKADYYYIKMFDDDEILIILCAISNAPVDDLVSYLR